MTDETKTIPWPTSQQILVNGYPLVYTLDPDKGIIVHIPGGQSISADELIGEGGQENKPALAAVLIPLRLRKR